MPVDEFLAAVQTLSPAVRKAIFAEPRGLSDSELKAQELTGPLSGRVCVVKDNIDLSGTATRAGSTFLASIRPSPRSEGPLIRRLRASGCLIMAKTQLNEFAYGLDGANPHVGDCPHPFLPGRCSGGSSSGSAWAVARGWADIGVGTDTGGSIRVPAAYCGLYGVRLPPGDWAQDGVFPLAPSFDTVGWMTSSAETMLQTCRVLLDLPAAMSELRWADATKGRVQGLPEEASNTEASRRWIAFAEAHEEDIHQAFNILQSGEVFDLHKDWLYERRSQYDPAVWHRIERGRHWTPEERAAARDIHRQVKDEFQILFESIDALALPINPEGVPEAPMSDAQRAALLRRTAPVSLAGYPVLTMPVSTDGESPEGLQWVLPLDRWKLVLATLLEGV